LTLGVGSPEQATWSFEHDTATLGVTKVTDPLGRVTASARYDRSGNVVMLRDALGNTTTAAYNQFNQPSWIKDPTNVQTTFSYDAAKPWRLTNVSTPLLDSSGATIATRAMTVASYDPSHPADATTVVDPNGKPWLLGYDPNGYLNALSDPLGNKTTIDYDSVGRPESMVTPKGNVFGSDPAVFRWIFATNPFGDITGVMSPVLSDGTQPSTGYHYDENRNLDRATDGEDHVTQYSYDDADQLIQQIRPDNSVLATDYYGDGSVHHQYDGASQPTTYAYDHQGRLTSVIDPLNRQTTYSYGDAASTVVNKQDPGGNCAATPRVGCTTETFDAVGQLKSVLYSDTATPNITDIGYDANGHRVSMTTGGAMAQWMWDSLGRLTSSTDDAGAQTSYDYFLSGAIKTITYPGAHTVTRGYDDAGRWTSVQDWLGNTTQFGYDRNSNNNSTTFPTGTNNTDTYGFDRADRINATTMKKSGATVASLAYTRDKTGLLKSVTAVGLPGGSQTYGYNSLNQLETVGGITQYDYDSADNLIQMLGSTYQSFDKAHQLCWQAGASSSGCTTPPPGATTFSYDTRGNRIGMTPAGDVPRAYGYDQANRLTSATVPTQTGDSGQYNPLAAVRIMDTRAGSGIGDCGSGQGSCTTYTAGATRSLQVTGVGGVPTAGVDSVVLNVTSLNSSAGYSTVYPAGSAQPGTASLLMSPAGPVANTVMVKVGTGGKINLAASNTTDLLVEVDGWYASPAGQANGTLFNAVQPVRLMDTRTAPNRVGNCGAGVNTCTTLASGGTQTLTVAGTGAQIPGIPANATAVAVNVTPINQTQAAYLTVGPADAPLPVASNVNWQAGKAVSNLVVTKLSTDGKIKLFNSFGTTDVIIDLEGYFTSAGTGTGNDFAVANPQSRIVDTRGTPYGPIGTCDSGTCSRRSAGSTTKIQAAGVGGIPANATAVVANITALAPATSGYMVFYAADQSPPNTSNLQAAAGQDVSVTAIIPLSKTSGTVGTFKLYTSFATDVAVDIQGWYAPAQATWNYTYNGTGLRKTKTGNGTTTSYTWSQAEALPMLDTEVTAGTSTSYIYGPAGLPVEQIASTGTTNTIYYLHHDQLGSTRLITDAGGNTVGTFTYDPYGKLSGSTGTVSTPLGYAGQYTDAETGFQYLRARYYDPATGQFLNRDPIEPITRSPYAYGLNSPLNYTDPSGLFPGQGSLDRIGGFFVGSGCGDNGILGDITDLARSVAGGLFDGLGVVIGSASSGIEAILSNLPALANAFAVVACIAGFMACAIMSGVAFLVRSGDAIDKQGWSNAYRGILADLAVTYFAVGVAGVAQEGLTITGPISVGGRQLAPAAPALGALGRGILGAFDTVRFFGTL
jgi:RHS repeat-associated protein